MPDDRRQASSRILFTQVAMYALPGLLAGVGALVALLSAGRITVVLLVLTVAAVVLGFGVPPTVDWLGGRYRRHVAQSRDVDDRLRLAAEQREAHVRQHFGPRGDGILPSQMGGGRLFTGRKRVLAELVAWLASPDSGDDRARVVTGGPGSGKSAVLGRLVRLADPAARADLISDAPPETVPPAGVLACAVHARGRTADEVAAEVAGALGADTADAAALLAMLREDWQRRPLAVLVDAVDEAADPFGLITELLEPLARGAGRTGVRVVAGTRRGGGDELLGLFAGSAKILDLDSPEYLEAGDLQEYVRRILVRKDDTENAGCYQSRPELAAVVAAAVADRASPSFLVGQLCALSLAAASLPVDVAEPGWQEQFPATVGAAMECYLRETRLGGSWLRDLLMPLAWAHGDGLDDPQLWAAIATVLGTAKYSEQDVARLVLDTPAADLLHRAQAGDRIVFRLFHEALGQHLRDHSAAYRAPAETQRRIGEAMTDWVPRSSAGDAEWAVASPYCLTWLAFHAAAGGTLGSLLEDAGFLVAAEPARLLDALPAVVEGRGAEIARAITRVGRQLLLARADEQASYLEMAARMASDDRLAEDLARAAPDRPWRVPWARWRGLDSGQLLGHHASNVWAVRAIAVRDGITVVSASSSRIRAWRLHGKSSAVPGVSEPPSPIVAMEAAAEADEISAITLHEDGQLRQITLAPGATFRTLARDRASDRGLWLINYTGQRAALTYRNDGEVELIYLADGRPVRFPAIAAAGSQVVATGNFGQQSFAAVRSPASGLSGEVTVWDLETQTGVGTPLRLSDHYSYPDFISGQDWPLTVQAAFTENDDQAVLLISIGAAELAAGGPVVAWDPVTAQTVAGPYYSRAAVSGLTRSRVGDDLLSCWGDISGNLYIARDLDGEPELIAAHESDIFALSACNYPSGSLIITGGGDGAVRAWQPNSGRPLRPAVTGRPVVVISAANGRPNLAVSIAPDGSGDVMDPKTGQIVGHLTVPAGEHLQAFKRIPNRESTVVTVDSQNQVAVWQLPECMPLSTARLPAGAWMIGSAVTPDPEPMLLSAQSDGQLDFFDITSGKSARATLACHHTNFTVAADPSPPDGVVRFATATTRPPAVARLWEMIGDQVSSRDLPLESAGEHKDPPTIYHLSYDQILDRKVIIAVGPYASLRIWDAADGTLIKHRRFKGSDNSLNDAEVASLNGNTFIFTVGYVRRAIIWEPATDKGLAIQVGSPLFSIRSLADGQLLIAGTQGIMAIHFSTADPPIYSNWE